VAKEKALKNPLQFRGCTGYNLNLKKFRRSNSVNMGEIIAT
jgi:hypothetical protein